LLSLEQLGTWAQVAEAAVAFGGILFVIYQVRQVNRTVSADAEGRLAEMASELRGLVVTHPELRPYLFEGQPLPEDADDVLRSRVATAVEMLLHYMDNLQKLSNVLSRHDRRNWEEFARDMLNNRCTIARQVVRDRPAWYRAQLREIAGVA
jgi:hypothetical protein